MRKKNIILPHVGLIIAVLYVAWTLAACGKTATPSADETRQVTLVVEGIGQRLQQVSVLSPTAAEDIKTQYAEYVSPVLLDQWVGDPSSAPGRVTSSPWPDHIEITSMDQKNSAEIVVNGNIIEVTSVEVQSGGAAATVPVQITLSKDLEGKWWITGWKQEGQ